MSAACSLVTPMLGMAVNGLMAQVLEGHVRAHLGTDQAPPEQRAQDVAQIVGVLRSYLR